MPWSYGISSGRIILRSRRAARSIPRWSAIASMTRSITKQPCTRPAPRYGVTITVFVYSEWNSTRYAPTLYGPSNWVEEMIGTMMP
jgi:hypothetical protein